MPVFPDVSGQLFMGKGLPAVRIICDNLVGPVKFPFVNDQTLQPDRAAGVNLIGADSHFSAKPVAKTVTEARAGVPENIGRINKLHKPRCGIFV